MSLSGNVTPHRRGVGTKLQRLLPASSLALAMAIAWCSNAMAQRVSGVVPTGVPLTVIGTIESKDPGAAVNVSGIACARPRADGRRTCVVADDEAGFAQRVTLDGTTMNVGERLPILTRVDDPSIIGRRPDGIACRVRTSKFRQMDAEGVAFRETAANGSGTFLVAGSQGCSRKDGEERPSQYILARIEYNAVTDRLGPATRTWRLAEALRTASVVGPRFGRPLDNDGGDGGIDVEGIAVRGDDLLVGLRAPSIGGNAFIVPVPLAPLFRTDGSVTARQTIPLALERREGVRDLASLPDGRVLVLTGPAPDRAEIVPRILVVDLGQDPAGIIELARLPVPTGGAKFEAIVAIDQREGRLTVLTLQDGPPNGNPTMFQLPLPVR